MPKKAKELSALAVSRLKEPGRHAVGGVDGLHLRIIGNSKAWLLRVKIGDRRCDIGLGPYPEVSLGDAREAEQMNGTCLRGAHKVTTLTIVELRTADVFQDMVRVHQKHRQDIPAGRICKVTCGQKSVLLVARGARNNQANSFAVDLRTRNRLGIASYGEEVQVTFQPANWFDEIKWGWRASEPISRIATRLAVISLGLGVISFLLGILGAVLGAIPLLKATGH